MLSCSCCWVKKNTADAITITTNTDMTLIKTFLLLLFDFGSSPKTFIVDYGTPHHGVQNL
jgi:hypothetical protein